MIANERPNSERYCHGKTPQQTVDDLIRHATKRALKSDI